MTVKQKSVLVTGASQGIGRGIALRLAQDGANLALVDIKADKLERVARRLRRWAERRRPSSPTSATATRFTPPSTMPRRRSAAST